MYGSIIITIGIIVCSIIMFSALGAVFLMDIIEQFKDKKRSE